ncbi:ankyrin repeat domain-containing protein [bacterium]|nr:ankyrin repeat domain-containing protein [bacterium]
MQVMISSVFVGITDICSSVIAWMKYEVYYSSVAFMVLAILIYTIRPRSAYWRLGLWSLVLIRLMMPPDAAFSYSCRNLLVKAGLTEMVTGQSDDAAKDARNDSAYLASPVHRNDVSGVRDEYCVSGAPRVQVGDLSLSVVLRIVLILGWLTGLLFFATLYFRTHNFFRKIVMTGTPIEKELVNGIVNKWQGVLKISRTIRIFRTDSFLSPFSMGTFKPTIVLPGALLDSADSTTLEAVISHELAHIKRFDDLFLKVQNCIQLVYFFHPLVWYVNRCIHDARELICDSLVLNRGQINAKEYGQGIISVLKLNNRRVDFFESVTCLIHRRKTLEKRLVNLIEGGRTMTRTTALSLFSVILILGIFVLPMALSQTQPAQETQTLEQKEQQNKSESNDIDNDDIDIDITDDHQVLIKKRDGQLSTIKTIAHDGKVIIVIDSDGQEKKIELREEDGKIVILDQDGKVKEFDIQEALSGIETALPENVEQILKNLKITHNGKFLELNQLDLNELAKDYSPLLKAALTGEAEQLKNLLDQGSDVNEANDHKSTALTLAAEFGHLDCVKLLLDLGADLNAADADGDTALTLALMKKHDEIAQLLIANGAKIDSVNKKGWTPLMWSVMNGNLEATQMLVKKGAEVNQHDSHNSTPLTLAAQFGHKAIVELLLKQGAEINVQDNDGDSPLLLALLNGHEEIADLLMGKGADLKVRNRHGSTLLTIAAEKGMTETVRMLLKQGLDINAQDNDGDSSLLLALVKKQADIVDLLLDQNADIMAVNNDGMSTLMFAAQTGNLEQTRYLLKKGVRLDQKNDQGSTALIIAAFHGHREVVNHLLKAGANINEKQDSGRTALIMAAWHGHADIVADLIEAGAKVNQTDHHNSTALTIAAEMGHTDVVKALIENKADLNARDDDQDSALALARTKKHQEIIELLEKAGAQE